MSCSFFRRLMVFVFFFVAGIVAGSEAGNSMVGCVESAHGEQGGRNVLYWPYFSFPPLYVVEDGELSGFGAEIQEMLMNDMPNQSHVRLAASPRRMFRESGKGRPFVIVGALKTEEREKSMYFSLPCRLAMNNLILIRTEDAHRLGNGRSVSLRKLLADSDVRMGVVGGVSYGQEVDDLLAEASLPDSAASLSGPEAMGQLARMLLKKRIDFTFADPSFVAWFERENEAQGELSLLYIEEMTTPALLGYVAVPKTEAGARTVEEVNGVLRRKIRSGELERILSGWAPESFQSEFRRLYKEMILTPVLD